MFDQLLWESVQFLVYVTIFNIMDGTNDILEQDRTRFFSSFLWISHESWLISLQYYESKIPSFILKKQENDFKWEFKKLLRSREVLLKIGFAP